jgi:hypothetical protein
VLARHGGGGGTASATAAVGNDTPRASRSAAAAFFTRMDVRRAAATMAGAAMLSHSRLGEQMLDSATRGGGGGRREASSLLRRTTTMDGIFPRTRRDANGCGDAAVPSDRGWRQLRRGQGTTRRDATIGGGVTTRDKSGRWTTQGERVESDEGATRWWRTATEVAGEEAVSRSQSAEDWASFEQVFWRVKKIPGYFLDHKPH